MKEFLQELKYKFAKNKKTIIQVSIISAVLWAIPIIIYIFDLIFNRINILDFIANSVWSTIPHFFTILFVTGISIYPQSYLSKPVEVFLLLIFIGFIITFMLLLNIILPNPF